ncbi:hypothetical protein DY000_02012696 [Brassica cretica]|uniref:Uncharacterized protein n=1 Tax=Brassica cretica TaxID=69181 RepID=A0ABQ7D6M4_BRACR|nr:hypothetical protein DY000_02012696 [Brassica cretica]
MSAMFSYSPSSPPPPPRFTSCCHFSLSLQLAPLIVIVSQVHLVVAAAATAPLIASVFPVSHFIATFLASLVITVSPAHLVIAATPTPLLIAAPLSPSGNAGSTKLVVSLTRSHFLYFAAPPAFHTVSDCDSPWWCWLCFHHGLDLLRSSLTFSHPLCFSLTPRDSLSFNYICTQTIPTLSFAFALSTPNLAASPASSQPHINIKSRTVTMRLLVKFNVFPDELFRAKVHDLRPSYPSLSYICYSPAEFFRTGVLCSIFFTKENLWRIIHHLSLSRDPSTIRDVYHRSQTPLDGYFNISFFLLHSVNSKVGFIYKVKFLYGFLL